MLGQCRAPDAEEIAARARICAHLFLNGCRPNHFRPLAADLSQATGAVWDPCKRQKGRVDLSMCRPRRLWRLQVVVIVRQSGDTQGAEVDGLRGTTSFDTST